MSRTRQIAVGLGVMIAGLVALAIGAAGGAAAGSHDMVVGTILLLVPLSISFCGAVVALIGLARQPENRSGTSHIRRIVGMVALAGLGLACGFAALGTLSQLPDDAAGLNGTYLPPSLFSILLLPAIGLLVGLGFGILIAFIWRATEGRQLPTATAAGAASPR